MKELLQGLKKRMKESSDSVSTEKMDLRNSYNKKQSFKLRPSSNSNHGSGRKLDSNPRGGNDDLDSSGIPRRGGNERNFWDFLNGCMGGSEPEIAQIAAQPDWRQGHQY